MEDKLTLTVKEAAKLLGIGRNLAYEMARRGELPALRFGRRILIPRHGVSAFAGRAWEKI